MASFRPQRLPHVFCVMVAGLAAACSSPSSDGPNPGTGVGGAGTGGAGGQGGGAVNAPPALDAIGDLTVAEGSTLAFTVTATDRESDPLTISASGLPEGALFLDATSEFTWTPDYSKAGAHQVVFKVVDDQGREDSENVTITVSDTTVPQSQASAGCVTKPGVYTVGTTEGSLKHRLRTRTFRVHVPVGNGASKPAAVVLMLHGGGGSGQQFQEESSRMDAVAAREGFITVYPDGTGALKTWNAGGCCGSSADNDVDDVGFISKLIDHLQANACVDGRRIYATGMSNGGMMAHRLACDLSDRMAAIGAVAGPNITASCTPSRPVPVMHIHGSNDEHALWDGGLGCGLAGVPFPSVPSMFGEWAQRHGCANAEYLRWQEADGRCTGRTGCKADLVLCEINGGGHFWPGGLARTPAIDCPKDGHHSTFPADEILWSFFSLQALP